MIRVRFTDGSEKTVTSVEKVQIIEAGCQRYIIDTKAGGWIVIPFEKIVWIEED